jgi:hypothetical protein
MSRAETQKQNIRSMNIPREVRDQVRHEAQHRGISASALVRQIIQDYVAGDLIVLEPPGPQIVSTSVWLSPELWEKFTAKSQREGHSTQWIFRSWLDREAAAA